ncbi:MAG: PASTA domain-containing protein, partial [Acidimicrobiales bacterium]
GEGRARGEGHRRRRWPWVLLAMVLLGAAAAAAAAAYLESRPPTAPVPDLDSRTEEEARALLDQAQAEAEEELAWEVVVDRDFNEAVAAGVVVSQDPPAGTELADGGTVALLVSQGPPPRAVPDLTGKTVDEATQLLAGAELAVGSVARTASEDVGEGRVITWGVEGQDRPAELPKGTEVDLVVSGGPALRTVPPLAGKTLEEARAALGELGLQVREAERFSSTVEKGRVIGTDPGPGASVARGSTVTVVASKGRDLVQIPGIVGEELERAIRRLIEAGLEPGQVFGPAQGKPDSTDPAAGATVDRGTLVNIYLKRR